MDGMTVDELPAHLRDHWPQLREQLLSGRYQPALVQQQPKVTGGVRKLGIPTVLDRFIQQALLQVLQPMFDADFSEHSHGFRPGRSRARRDRRGAAVHPGWTQVGGRRGSGAILRPC
jgi:retron-type reverse transcriptase